MMLKWPIRSSPCAPCCWPSKSSRIRPSARSSAACRCCPSFRSISCRFQLRNHHLRPRNATEIASKSRPLGLERPLKAIKEGPLQLPSELLSEAQPWSYAAPASRRAPSSAPRTRSARTSNGLSSTLFPLISINFPCVFMGFH